MIDIIAELQSLARAVGNMGTLSEDAPTLAFAFVLIIVVWLALLLNTTRRGY